MNNNLSYPLTPEWKKKFESDFAIIRHATYQGERLKNLFLTSIDRLEEEPKINNTINKKDGKNDGKMQQSENERRLFELAQKIRDDYNKQWICDGFVELDMIDLVMRIDQETDQVHVIQKQLENFFSNEDYREISEFHSDEAKRAQTLIFVLKMIHVL
jgi:hypothetical protein